MWKSFGLALCLVWMTPFAQAESREVLEAGADKVLSMLRQEVRGGKALLDDAVAVLVMPLVVPLQFGEGGEYGEGVLLVGDRPVAYYAVSGGNMGKRADTAVRSQVLVFNERKALIDFRNNQAWQAQPEVNVRMAHQERSGRLSRDSKAAAVLAFVLDGKGARNELSVADSIYKRIAR